MKPDYLSHDEYGSVMLDYLLMYVNNVFSLEEFNLDSVIVPNFSAIVDIAKDKYAKKTYGQLESIAW